MKGGKMVKQKIMILVFILGACLTVADVYAGQIICDGKVGHGTDKASGKLLVAVGFLYTAMGLVEAGEQQKIDNLWKLIDPVAQAKGARKLFEGFVKAELPQDLKKLDALIRKTNYVSLYVELKGKELIIPAQIWDEVSGKAKKEGLKGLVGV